MKRVVILLIFICSTIYTSAQITSGSASFDCGYSLQNEFIIMNHNRLNNISFGFMSTISCDGGPGQNGEDYTGIIHRGELYWNNEYECSDKVGSFNFLAGYHIYKGICINTLVGWSSTQHWINGYDKYHILSSNGSYHYGKYSTHEFNYGAFINYTYKFLSLSAGYSKHTNIFFTVGVNLMTVFY